MLIYLTTPVLLLIEQIWTTLTAYNRYGVLHGSLSSADYTQVPLIFQGVLWLWCSGIEMHWNSWRLGSHYDNKRPGIHNSSMLNWKLPYTYQTSHD